MNTLTTHQSMHLLEGLQEALPALIASSDFFDNLESSLQIITDLFGFDAACLLVDDHSSTNPNNLKVLLAMEKSSDGWRELIERKDDGGDFILSNKIAKQLFAKEVFLGDYETAFSKLSCKWKKEKSDGLMLIPLFSQEDFKGALGLGGRSKDKVLTQEEEVILNTYCKTLGHWIQRYEKYKTIRRERDKLRDIINLGDPALVKDTALTPDWERSVTDAQLLNRKITTTIPDQIFIIDLKDQSNLFSNRPVFLGYPLDNIDNPFEFFQKLIHPDDLGPAFENFFEKLMQVTDDDVIESEYRMYDNEGKVVWFNERVKVFKRDDEGQVWQYINVLQDITARKLALEASHESDILFRSLYEKNPLGVCISDEQGNILRFNEMFTQILGYNTEDLTEDAFLTISHADDVAKEMEFLISHAKKQTPFVFMEKRYLHKKGHTVWADVNISFLYRTDGSLRLAIAMIEDITEKKKIHRALEINEAFQKAILRTLPDLKFRISKGGSFLDYYPSPNDEKDLIAAPSSFVGKRLEETLPPYISQAISVNIEKAIKTGSLREFEYVLPIEEKLNHFEVRINAINQEEVIAVVRNVSDRNWAQMELKARLKELDDTNKQLKEYIDSNMQLENFAYIASHDLREPLRTMGTFAQLLQKRYGEKLDESANTYIDFVVKSAKDMNNLIEDLLTYSRIETQDNPFVVIDLPDLLEEMLSGLKETIEENQAIINLKNIPSTVTANPSRLKQLFQNLVANAIKFKKPDVNPIIIIEGKDTGRHWQFAIKDNGIGIDPDFHKKIFLLFKKLHSRKDFQGTGLGLAICRKVVEQMQGDIWIESEVGAGSTFYFTIKKSK